MRRPSNTLGKICLFIERTLILGMVVVGVSRLQPTWLGYGLAGFVVLGVLFWVVLNLDFSSLRLPKNFDGTEWRVVKPTLFLIFAMMAFQIFVHVTAPESAPTMLESVWLVSVFSFVGGAFLGSDIWHKNARLRPYQGPGPDDGLAGVGAGVRPPTPTLHAGNRAQTPER